MKSNAERKLETSLSLWLLCLLSGKIALKTLGLSSKYWSNKACDINTNQRASPHETANTKKMRELKQKADPRRFVERNISSDSWRVSCRLNGHLILDHQRLRWWSFLRLCCCTALPLWLLLLLLQLHSPPISMVTWRQRGGCNFTHFQA